MSAAQTSDLARSALRSGKGVGFPELLKLIEALTTNLANATIADIAELIEQDAAVMSQLLAVANTIVYNPHVAPLSSVPHAIHQVGFQRIRSLAVSLMLIENTGAVGKPPEQREAAAHALCSGLLAQGWAHALGTLDPEVVFAGAVLRQLGYIVLPGVALEHYREAQRRQKTKQEDAAYRSVFGITPLELSRRILSDSRLPQQILRSLRPSDPEMAMHMTISDDARLLGLVDLGGRLAGLALDSNSSAEVFGRKSRGLARKYDRLLPGVSELLEPALVYADERISSLSRTTATTALPVTVVLRMKSRLRRVDPPATTTELGNAAVGIAAAPAPTPRDKSVVGEDVATSADGVQSGSTAAAPAAKGEAPVKPRHHPWADESSMENDSSDQRKRPRAAVSPQTNSTTVVNPWEAAVATLRESFEASEIWIFLPETRSAHLVAAQGSGGRWKEHWFRASVRHDERSVFGVCLTRRQMVAIHNTADPSIQRYLPEWFRRAPTRPGAFLIIPLSEPNYGLGVIAWLNARPVAPTTAQSEEARLLFESLVPGPQSKT